MLKTAVIIRWDHSFSTYAKCSYPQDISYPLIHTYHRGVFRALSNIYDRDFTKIVGDF